MRWGEWKFSAQRAVQDPWIRWTTVIAVVLLVAASVFYLARVIPAGWQSGLTTLHYNVYLGIDDVRAWQWAFSIPALALAVLAVDTLVALGLFRQDPIASRTLTATGLAAIIIWSVAVLFLVLVNV
jgi:hypothetical protein